ncbi:DUF4179 domain-containing protein [Bacillus timonensis]|uniref:DUF4179 domain-containing protein n=1 Tax=Bacillus timonensis TaxID=1033734 RepID=A0A4S3PN29_9BACI|nr:DUF4179 domain-containing protein [Bacillus timonensis]THE10967.1 DUF4179 domain-containing protein [Bacillus timonensis]
MDKWEEKIKIRANPQVPASVENRMNETLRSLPKKKTYPRFYYPVAAVFLVGFLLFGISFMSPTLAETLKSAPVIGSIFKMVGDIGTQKGEKEGLTTLLGKQVEIDGQVITFTESLYDGSQIHIGYLIESYTQEKTTYPTDFLSNLRLTIDGKGVSYGMGERGEVLENGDYAGILSIRVDDELPDQFTLGIRSQKEKALHVELPITKQGDNRAFLVNETVASEDLTIHVDKVTFFPTSTEIVFRQIMDEKVFESKKYDWLDYQIVDDKGNVLQPFSGGGGGGPMKNGQLLQTYSYYYEPLETMPKSLTFKPYLIVGNEKVEEVKADWTGEKLTLSQGGIGEITVLDIKSENNIVTLIVETKGEDAFWQANNILIEKKNGEALHQEQTPKRIENAVHQYEVQFAADVTEDDIRVVTYKQKAPKFLKELEVTIEVGE